MWCLWWMGRSAHLEGLEWPDEHKTRSDIPPNMVSGISLIFQRNWEWNLITEWTLKWTLTDSPSRPLESWSLLSSPGLGSCHSPEESPPRLESHPPPPPPPCNFLCPWSAGEGGGNTLTAVQYLLHRRYYRPSFTAMGPVAMANPHLQVCYPDSISSVEVTAHGLQQILTDSRNWLNCNEMQKVSMRTTSWPTH